MPNQPTPDPEYEAPFAQLLDIRSGQSADGIGSVTMPIQEMHRQTGGVVQGGLIVTLADHALYRAVASLLDEGETSVTIELKLNFIAPAKDGTLTATAKVISRGRRVVVGDMDVINDRQTLIAHGTGTCMIVRPRK